jgi:predicted kinase
MKQTIYIMIGYPASGKSGTSALLKQANPNLVVLDGDTLKTKEKVQRELRKALDGGFSVLIDACHTSLSRRQPIIAEAKARGLEIYAFWITTPFETCMIRNKIREEQTGKKVPKVAFYMHRKDYVEPTLEEGFTGIVIIKND